MHLLLLTLLTTAPSAPVKFALPGFNGGNVPADVVAVASEHFAQQLTLQGFRVVTGAEIQAALGLERQKQLMGCTDDGSSCLAELSSALGVDGIISGSLGRFGSRYTVNVKVVRSSDAKQLAVFSATVDAESLLPDVLSRAAREVAAEVQVAMGHAPQSKAAAAPGTGGAWTQRRRAGAVAIGVGAGLGVLSAILATLSYVDYADLRRAATQANGFNLSVSDAFRRHDLGELKLVTAVLSGALALAGILVGGSFFFSDDPRALRVSLEVGPGAFALAWGGTWP